MCRVYSRAAPRKGNTPLCTQINEASSFSSSSLFLSSLEMSDTQSLCALNTSPPRNRCTFLWSAKRHQVDHCEHADSRLSLLENFRAELTFTEGRLRCGSLRTSPRLPTFLKLTIWVRGTDLSTFERNQPGPTNNVRPDFERKQARSQHIVEAELDPVLRVWVYGVEDGRPPGNWGPEKRPLFLTNKAETP